MVLQTDLSKGQRCKCMFFLLSCLCCTSQTKMYIQQTDRHIMLYATPQRFSHLDSTLISYVHKFHTVKEVLGDIKHSLMNSYMQKCTIQ